MSASFHRGGWEVRWRDASGSRRARRFASEDAARAFDEALAEVSPTARRSGTARPGRGGGVYSYRTADGVRWRFVFRRSDGTQSTKRGFPSERAARDARRRLIEPVERGEVRHTKETFGPYWERWLARRKPYLEAGTWTGYEIAGRKRLMPAFGARSLGELSVYDIRECRRRYWLWRLRPVNWPRRRSTTPSGPSSGVSTQPSTTACLPSTRRCGCNGSRPRTSSATSSASTRFRATSTRARLCTARLAELLVGNGLRISEPLALRITDLEQAETGGTIVVYRSRKSDTIDSTKSDRFRPVEIGPSLCSVLRDQVARRAELVADGAAAVLFVMPVRTVKRSQRRWQSAGVSRPLDRNKLLPASRFEDPADSLRPRSSSLSLRRPAVPGSWRSGVPA